MHSRVKGHIRRTTTAFFNINVGTARKKGIVLQKAETIRRNNEKNEIEPKIIFLRPWRTDYSEYFCFCDYVCNLQLIINSLCTYTL